MNELILVRHAAPQVVPGQPANRWRLSPAGRAQCPALAEQVRRHAPRVLLSSPEPKALETARLLAAALGLPVETVPGLHEHARSHYPWVDQATFEQALRNFFDHPQDLVLGEETADQARARFSTTLHAQLVKYPGRNLAVVSHGTVISLYAAGVLGVDPFQFWKQLGMPACVVLPGASPQAVRNARFSPSTTDPG